MLSFVDCEMAEAVTRAEEPIQLTIINYLSRIMLKSSLLNHVDPIANQREQVAGLGAAGMHKAASSGDLEQVAGSGR